MGEDATLNMHISPSPYSPAVGVGLDHEGGDTNVDTDSESDKGEDVGDGLNHRGSDANEDTDSYSDRDSISDSDKSEDGGVGAHLNTHQPPPAFHDSPTRSVSPSREDDWGAANVNMHPPLPPHRPLQGNVEISEESVQHIVDEVCTRRMWRTICARRWLTT